LQQWVRRVLGERAFARTTAAVMAERCRIASTFTAAGRSRSAHPMIAAAGPPGIWGFIDQDGSRGRTGAARGMFLITSVIGAIPYSAAA
jgi:hypothetical protein